MKKLTMLGYTRKVLPRIDKEMGRTHHDKDSCYKCNKCGGHYPTEEEKKYHQCSQECWISVVVEK